jgi:hypothetical protein
MNRQTTCLRDALLHPTFSHRQIASHAQEEIKTAICSVRRGMIYRVTSTDSDIETAHRLAAPRLGHVRWIAGWRRGVH